MIRPIGRTRHAEEFDTALSGGPSAPEHDELLGVVASLRAVPDVVAREEFVSSLRTQLVAAAEREPARVERELAAKLTPRQRKGSRERRLAAVVGGFAVVSATGSMAVASQSALPGDALYPVKRAIENAKTNLQSDASSRADIVLSHAEARLDEAQELTARGADADTLSATLQDFTDQAEQASELTLDAYAASGRGAEIAELREFARSSMDLLAALGPLVPEGVRPILITATQTVRQIDLAAWEACSSCADGAITEVPDFATMPLAAMLSGDLPRTASVSAPLLAEERPARGKDAEPEKKATDDATGATDEQPLPEVDEVVDPVEGPVKKAVDDITERVDDSVDSLKDAEQSDQGLTGKLVDGIAGVLGSLLR